MKKLARRDRMKIYGDLLFHINNETKKEKIILTHVQTKMNVPFDRLKSYIAEMQDLKLIKDNESLELTEKGLEYLRDYKMVQEFMKRMGIIYR